ncbi:hypothetical protein [Devosia sp. A16]|uniref:hypothetical protein n=1 Tax=Devosia sp. A16 TaxID=1736675 RepID=UPI0006D7D756|nr:hypothetical protein [Devosia sp. A16]
MNTPEVRHRRATNVDVHLNRQVVETVHSVRERIGTWQSAAVRLKTRYQFEPSGAGKQKLAHEAHELLQEITRTADELSAEAVALPEAVTRHSRFQDVVRALQSVQATLESFAAPHRQTPPH